MKRVALFFLSFLGLAVGWRMVNSRVYHSGVGINLAVVGEDKVAVIGVSSDNDGLIWVNLPSNLRIDGYPAVSIWGLGEIDGKSEELVKSSLGEGLGLWLRAAVKVEGGVSVDGLLKRLLSFKKIEGLGWIDRYVLYKDISTLAVKGVVLEMDLPYQTMDKAQDVDGYEWTELNEVVFVWSRDLWPKEEVVNLGIKAEVVNVSGVAGRARVKARQLESVGFRVVKVETGERSIDRQCLVKVGRDIEAKDELLRQILEDYLGCKIEMTDETEKMVFFVS